MSNSFNSPSSGHPAAAGMPDAPTIQPHGVLLAVQGPQLRIVQASANVPALLQRPLAWLLNATLRDLGGDIDCQVRAVAAATPGAPGPQPLRCSLAAGGRTLVLDGLLYQVDGGVLIAELEPLDATAAGSARPAPDLLQAAVQRLSEAASLPALADALACSLRGLLGHQQVDVLQRLADGSTRCLARSHDGPTPPAPAGADRGGDLGGAGELDGDGDGDDADGHLQLIADADAAGTALLPGGAAAPCLPAGLLLRSPSAPQRRRLRAHGAVASLQLPLLRQGRPWALVRCLHPQRRPVPPALRAAAELLAEVAATRAAAIEQYGRSQALAQALAQVRQLRQRLLAAAAGAGDWRLALLHDPVALLQPLNAGGAALLQHGHSLSCGHAPAGSGLDALALWIGQQPGDDGAFACDALAAANPALRGLPSEVSGVLALRLSTTEPDYLMWFRTPQQRSPAWSGADVAVARAFADALVDVAVQVDAVRLLIAEQQAARLRAAVAGSREAVVVADAERGSLHANGAFLALAGCTPAQCASLDALVVRFEQPALARQVIGQVQAEGRPWHGELALAVTDAAGRHAPLPVALRIEPVPARDGTLLGLILIFNDLGGSQRADAARHRLEAALSQAGRGIHARHADEQLSDGHPHTASDGLLAAILTNASLAAMDIAEAGGASAALLQALQASTERAAALCGRIGQLGVRPPS